MIKKIGVLGSGQMGAGIAQVAAQGGYLVVLSDREIEIAKNAVIGIQKTLGKLVDKGKISSQDAAASFDRISPATGVAGFGDCDLVIEAATENPALKFKLISDLDQACQASAVLATNTSISVTAIAAKTRDWLRACIYEPSSRREAG